MPIENPNVSKGLDYEYNLLMSSLHVSVSKHLMDEYFTVIWANDCFYERTLYTKEEYETIYHNECSTYFKQDMVEYEKFALAVGTAIANHEPGYEAICKMPQKGGSYIWIKIVGTFSEERMNGIPVIYVTFTDITDAVEQQEVHKKLEERSKELAEALKAAEKANRAKSDFLSRMSHDIRTPMNAIVGMTDIAEAHIDDQEKVKDCLKKISLSSQHLLGLINDVLDMSKIESGKIALHEDVMSLPEVLENIVAIMQPQFKEREQKFSIRLQKVTHEQFYSDALRIRQVLINILSNACKFTPPGGSIDMDVEEKTGEDESTALMSFTVKDTGIGMQPEFLEHIFDSFSRERDSRVDKTEGTGLGMAITKKLVELLGGEIEVSSSPGKGTTFCVTLPLKIEEMPAVEKSYPDLHIIVADDDAAMCEYTVEMLERLGIHAEWVNSGEGVLAKLREASGAGISFDAVILDWKMPDMDGLETTKRLRKAYGKEMPILIISAYDWGDIEERALEAGVTGFLSKPVFISTLCYGIQRYVLGMEPEPQESREHSRAANFKGKRLLLAEDNELNREVATELLADTGAVIDIACNGAQAVEMFGQSEEGFYDLILMDIQMPVMDGYMATRKIRAMEDRADAPTVPILAMTADAFAEDIAAAKAAGMDDHLAKPLDEFTLKRRIGKYL